MEGLSWATRNLLDFLDGAGLPLPSWLWPAASSDRWHRIGKLPMLAHMAGRAKRHQVLKKIITLLAPLDLMVDLRGSLCHERPRAGRVPLSVSCDRGSRLELGGDHHRADAGAVQRRLDHVHRVLLRTLISRTRLVPQRQKANSTIDQQLHLAGRVSLQPLTRLCACPQFLPTSALENVTAPFPPSARPRRAG